MAIRDWWDARYATDFWDFEGEGPGTVIGSPSYVDGLGGGLAASTDGDDGFVVTPRLPRDTSDFTIGLWLLPSATSPSGSVFRWGSTPGVGIDLNGADGGHQPGTATIWVRVSNGNHALRVTTTEPLAADRWHLVVVTVRNINLRGGVEAAGYVDGERVGIGRYTGGLFNWVNMDRPRTATILAGGAAAAVDEMGMVQRPLSASEVSSLVSAGPSDTTVARYGWGIVF